MDNGPIHLVEAGLPEQLAELGWQVKFDGHHQFATIDAENDPPIGKLKNPRFVSRVCKSVAEVVGDHAKKGQLPLTLGGDHSLVGGPQFFLGVTHCWYRRPWAPSPELWSTFRSRPSCCNFARPVMLTCRRKYPDACVIWVDAHADINTAETTDSGILLCLPGRRSSALTSLRR